MKQALLSKPGEIVLRSVERPEVGPGDLLIRVSYAGVCGSDLHSFRGSHPFRSAPVVLGHEVSGTVAAMGDAVRALSWTTA